MPDTRHRLSHWLISTGRVAVASNPLTSKLWVEAWSEGLFGSTPDARTYSLRGSKALPDLGDRYHTRSLEGRYPRELTI